MPTPSPFTTARKAATAVALSFALILTGSQVAASASTTAPAIPAAIAAAGDSISVATNYSLACAAFRTCARGSWTTGSLTSVDSHFLRLRDYNSGLAVRNAAVNGAKAVDLSGQFATILANNFRPGYLTVMIGANDLCGTSLTDTATFRSQFHSAMTSLYATSPNTSVFVGSIPSLQRLYDLLKTNKSALSTWDLFKICPLMLAPNSTSRELVNQRQAEFNDVLEQVCAEFAAQQLNRCKFDGDAVFNTVFVTTDVSTVDYFHPSAAGQKKLAAATWAQSFWPTR